MKAAVVRLVAVLAVATFGIVMGASARNKIRHASADPAVTGSITPAIGASRRTAPTDSPVIPQFQHGPDRRMELIEQGFARVRKTGD